MRCPFCSHEDTAVRDSRPSEDHSAIRRRRVCTACGSRFTTFERVQLRDMVVLKRSGARQSFDRDKLARSIFTALRKRPIDSERAERMITGIVRVLEAMGDVEITSQHIGELVMQSLIQLDLVAYIRFASVYRDFRDMRDFEALISDLTKAQTDAPPLWDMPVPTVKG